jgi:hypothetical protein
MHTESNGGNIAMTGASAFGLCFTIAVSDIRLDEYADRKAHPLMLKTITPADWEGTTLQPQRWLAFGRIPAGDVTILAGNGGAGKTEIIVQLLVYVTGGLPDWLGCTIENGVALAAGLELYPWQSRSWRSCGCLSARHNAHAVTVRFRETVKKKRAWL